jgi:hypothetical protein
MPQASELSEREYFGAVARWPQAYVGKASFHMMAAFLDGYDAHAGRCGRLGLSGWRDWLIARRGRECNHAWPGQVLHIALPHGWENIWDLPPDDDKRALTVLFVLLDEFLAERETAPDTGTSP